MWGQPRPGLSACLHLSSPYSPVGPLGLSSCSPWAAEGWLLSCWLMRHWWVMLPCHSPFQRLDSCLGWASAARTLSKAPSPILWGCVCPDEEGCAYRWCWSWLWGQLWGTGRLWNGQTSSLDSQETQVGTCGKWWFRYVTLSEKTHAGCVTFKMGRHTKCSLWMPTCVMKVQKLMGMRPTNSPMILPQKIITLECLSLAKQF